MALRVGFIGTGDERNPGRMGYGMAHRHAAGYKALGDLVELVACCDLIEERRQRFAKLHNVPKVYSDYQEMLATEDLDIVSICTWPDSHCQLVVDTAKSGVKAIHCEKPMAFTWGEAKRMAEECEQRGVKLTFNHQRRFGAPFRKAKALLDEGRIGELRQVAFGVGDLYDYGSHNWDMSNYFNDQTPVRWVLAQIEYSKENLIFGVHNENQAIAVWEYENGVTGLAATGPGSPAVGCHNRLVGTKGVIEIGRQNEPVLRVWSEGQDLWEVIDCGDEGLHGPGYIERAIADVVTALLEDKESELNARNALQATEPIFAAWESVRRRGRVELPLNIEDNPLQDMVDRGVFRPA